MSDRIEGLNAGADDYLVKPFDLAELSARIGSVARRYSGNPNPIVTHGALEIDLAARSIRRDGKPVQLTAREWALFEAFLSRPGQLLSKAQLEEKLYAFDAEVESNTIEVHVSRLRKKLGPRIIETERGMGYRLGAAMRLPRSLQARLGLSLGVLLTVLWIAAASVTAVILRREMDEVFDFGAAGNRAAPAAACRRGYRRARRWRWRDPTAWRDPRARRVLHLHRPRRGWAHPAAIARRRSGGVSGL